MQKTLLFLTLIGLLALTCGPITVYAQETEIANNESTDNESLIISPEIMEIDTEQTPENTITPAVSETTEIGAQDLGVDEPNILPTSRFYFLKNAWRGIRLWVARSPEKQAELKLKYANEKLVELKKIAERAETKQEIIEKTMESYQNDLEEAKKYLEKIEEKKAELKEKFKEKYLEHNLKHQLILQKLSNQVPVQTYEIIQENRKQHLKRFQEVMENVAEKQDVKKNIENTLQEIAKTRPLIRLQATEVLKNLREGASEPLKLKLQKIETDNLKNLTETIQRIAPEKRQEILEKKLDNLANPLTATEVADEIMKTTPSLAPVIEKIRTNSLENLIINKFQSLDKEKRENILEKLINEKENRIKILEKFQTRLENMGKTKMNQAEVQEQIQTKLESGQTESSSESIKKQKQEQKREQKQILPKKEIQPRTPVKEKSTYQPTELLKKVIDKEKIQLRIQPQSIDPSKFNKTE